jgi:hypothetical protein
LGKYSGKSFFALITAAYLLCASGYVDCVDALPSIDMARSFLSEGSLEVSSRPLEGTFYGTNAQGKTFSLMGFTYPILYLPAVILGQFAGAERRDRVTYFFVSLVNPLLTAILVCFLYLMLVRWGFAPRSAGWIAIAMGFATALFPYSKTCFREPLQALCLFSAWAFYLPKSKLKHRYLGSGCALALGILTKEAFLVPALPLIALLTLDGSREKDRVRPLCFALLPVVVAGALWIVFNSLAWGLGNTGYSHDVSDYFHGKAWSTPILLGIAMQWLSTENSFFLYNPLLIVCLPILVWKFRVKSLDRFDVAVALTIFAQTLFYARWYTPIGKEALGPRFLVTTIPLYFIFLRNVRWNLNPTLLKFAVVVFAIVQFVSVAVKMQEYWTARAVAHSLLTTPHWKANFHFFSRKIASAPEIYDAEKFGGQPQTLDLENAATLRGFNFWWAHVLRMRRGPRNASAVSY